MRTREHVASLGRAWAALLLVCALSPPALAAVPQAPALRTRDAEVLWRWIGELTAGAEGCVPSGGLPDGWTGAALFSGAARSRFAPLEDFCLYQYDGAGAVQPLDLAFISGLDGVADADFPPPASHPPAVLDAVVPDQMAVVASGALGDALWLPLAGLFDEQAGRVSGLLPVGGSQVSLTLLDTSPTPGGGPDERSVHGRTLRWMAQRLLCPDGSCLAEIRSRLALAFESVDAYSREASARDSQRGGFVGLIGELATAVTEEVDAWKAAASSQDRLILNLSLAWDPLYGGGDPGQPPDAMPPHVRAVYRALESVACDEQVLAVAAAGNLADRHAGNSLDQPLLPAAWRRRDAVCPGFEQGPPMLVAVGGIDRRRRPLGNAIEGGMPELVAYGDHAAVQDPASPGTPGAVLTGSSVAALVVSASLAAVAAYRQDLDFGGIVASTYTAGEDLGAAADFCPAAFAGDCPPVRAVSFCDSVRAACLSGASHCPSLPVICDPRPSQVPALPGGALPPMGWQIDTALLVPVTSPLAPVCGYADVHAAGGQMPADPCPDRQYHGLGRHPYTHPQPQSVMCPNCIVFLDGPGLSLRRSAGAAADARAATASSLLGPSASLYGEIDSGGGLGPLQALSATVIELDCGAGPAQVYALAGSGFPAALQDGDRFAIHGLPASCERGTVQFVLEEGGEPLASVRQPFLFAIRQ